MIHDVNHYWVIGWLIVAANPTPSLFVDIGDLTLKFEGSSIYKITLKESIFMYALPQLRMECVN